MSFKQLEQQEREIIFFIFQLGFYAVLGALTIEATAPNFSLGL